MRSLLAVQFFILCVFVLGGVLQSNAQEIVAKPNSEDKEKCVQEFLNWCKKMKNPSGTSGVSVLSVSFYDGQKNARVFCTMDSEGADCLKNRSPWFSCSPNGTLNYKGEKLDETSASSVDDEVCETKDSALKFHNQVEFNRTLFEQEMKGYHEGMDNFFRGMTDFQHQMKDLQNRFFNRDYSVFRPDESRGQKQKNWAENLADESNNSSEESNNSSEESDDSSEDDDES